VAKVDGEPAEKASEEQRRPAKGGRGQNWGRTGRDRAEEGQHSPEIADEIAPLIHSVMWCCRKASIR
jgi:hypothetical protein